MSPMPRWVDGLIQSFPRRGYRRSMGTSHEQEHSPLLAPSLRQSLHTGSVSSAGNGEIILDMERLTGSDQHYGTHDVGAKPDNAEAPLQDGDATRHSPPDGDHSEKRREDYEKPAGVDDVCPTCRRKLPDIENEVEVPALALQEGSSSMCQGAGFGAESKGFSDLESVEKSLAMPRKREAASNMVLQERREVKEWEEIRRKQNDVRVERSQRGLATSEFLADHSRGFSADTADGIAFRDRRFQVEDELKAVNEQLGDRVQRSSEERLRALEALLERKRDLLSRRETARSSMAQAKKPLRGGLAEMRERPLQFNRMFTSHADPLGELCDVQGDLLKLDEEMRERGYGSGMMPRV